MILRKLNNNINEEYYLANIEANNEDFRESLINNNFNFPEETPVEIHPYLDMFELQSYNKYIIGTFPPIGYMRDQLNIPNELGTVLVKPKIPFYHGNDCVMWKVFFDEHELDQIGPMIADNDQRFNQRQLIIDKLNEKEINYSDIIYSVKRTAYDTKDQSLHNIVPNYKLICHILTNENAVYLNFNTSTVFSNQELGIVPNNHGVHIAGDLRESIVGSYNLFLKILQKLEFKLEVNLMNDNNWIVINQESAEYLNTSYRFKAYSKLRISTINKVMINLVEFENFHKELIIITGPSPSGQASRSMGRNLIYQNWRELNQNHNIATPTIAFRKDFYQNFIDQPELLIEWNI
ncbi:hypothetical protein [Bizionia myxarmorum]|uniref:Uncharacterized protein n=1 Tax=Bizionia myxarmorum TaxID=291186 RepID=A0A5D0RDX8_9FLAO|nr:hypothetical protein [Bizionia myxarmorum]TYB79186.1 hypothetical protein ES674_05265 [Bizionia myxarmorum]